LLSEMERKSGFINRIYYFRVYLMGGGILYILHSIGAIAEHVIRFNIGKQEPFWKNTARVLLATCFLMLLV
jgi:hypothetical protein